MATSPEYPDLRWMPPRSWTDANRSSVQLIVIHTTEGSSHAQSAEDGAAYDQRRTDGTSAHYFVDSDSVVQCVQTADQAHTARSQGNRRGIHYELCGRAGSQDWASAYSRSMLAQAARQCARDAKKWGISVRHLSVAQVADGAKGFCAHHDITRAFPQDGGTHTDPGPNFPWSQFLDMVRAEMEDEDMTFEADQVPRNYPAPSKDNPTITGPSALGSARDLAHETRDLIKALSTKVDQGQAAVVAAVKALAGADHVDEQALAAQLAPAVAGLVLQGLPHGSDPVTPAELTASLRSVLHDAFASQP